MPKVTKVENVPLIKAGTGAIHFEVVRIYKACVEAVRRIVDSVAVGVGGAKRKLTNIPPHRRLECVVSARGSFLYVIDVSVTGERTYGIRVRRSARHS